MGGRAWMAGSLVVAALASLCVAGVAADPDTRADSALGESESRLVDLRYELSVRLPNGVLPCELNPDEGVMHAVEKAVFDAINHDVAPLPRNAGVRLACVCEGERCDEHCAEDFHAPEERIAAPTIESALGAARAPAKITEKASVSSARTAAAARARVRSRFSDASRRSSDPAYFAEYGKYLDRDDDIPALGSARYYTLYEKCSMNATYYAAYEGACAGLTEEDGAYELEHKCRRPSFRRSYGSQCPHPSRAAGRPAAALVDPASDLEICQSKCAATKHCCNNDAGQGANQHLSCLQACVAVRSGVSGDECLSYCPEKRCAFEIGDARYVTCQTCDDVPAHAVRFGEAHKPAPYECSARYGSDEESCRAGCAAGTESTAETAEEATAPDDAEERSEASEIDGPETAADVAIEDWFKDHVGLSGCMPEVPTGQPYYLTLWEKCHTNWVFHKRNAARCEGLTEANGCAELERHCLRLRFAEEYHDQCEGVLLAQQTEEMIENAIAAESVSDDEGDEEIDVVAAVNAAVDARLEKYGLLTKDGDVTTANISPSQMKVLMEKLDSVIANVTASETSVEDKVDATIAEHLREMIQKEIAPAPPRRAPLVSETELLDSIKKMVQEDRLPPDESKIVLEKAVLFADAIVEGKHIDKIAMTLQVETEAAACALAFSTMDLDPDLGVCVAEVIAASRRTSLSLKSYHVTILLSAVTIDAPALEVALMHLADEGVTTMTTQIDPAAALEAAVPGCDATLLEKFKEEAEAIVEAEREEAKIEEARVTPASHVAPGPTVAPSSPPPAPPAPLESETWLLESVPASAAAEVTFLADAIAADATLEKISMTIQAESEEASCEVAFEMMQLDPSLGECSAVLVEDAARRKKLRRRMLAETLASYHVTILLRGDVVDAMALESALVHLATEGVATMTTETDPATELEAIEGVDKALVEAFEEEAEAAHAPATTSSPRPATDPEIGPAMGPAVAPPHLDDKTRRVSDCTTALERAAEETARFEELSDLEQCQARCASQNHCCNSDIAQGSNQKLSCLQACMVVKSGVAEEECLAYCPFKSCSRWIRGVHYASCQFCDDVPAHAGRYAADEIVAASYECSSKAGASSQTCEDGCRAGAATDPIVAAPGPPAKARAASGTAPGTEPGEATGEAPIRAEDAGGPLRGCSPEETADARARDGDHYVTLRFGVSVPAAVRAETIHAIKATATLDDVSRALERDEAFASAWPGRLARRDFKPVEGSEAVVDKGAASRAVADASSRSAERLEEATASSREVRPDGREAADAIAAAEAALEAHRAEALRLAAEVEGDMRTSSSGRYWQRAAALGAAAGGGGGSAETGSGWSFAAAGAAATAAAAAAVAASRAARDRGTAAERVPLTGFGATATVF